MMTNRALFEAALAGRPVERPIYAVYDWFVRNRPIDWRRLFGLGLGQIQHATVLQHRRPHVEVVQTRSTAPDSPQRIDTRWITDIGELHEWHLGEWRQEYLVKQPEDYRILARAMSDVDVSADMEDFRRNEAEAGENGATLAVPATFRTPFQRVQIDFAGLEQFSCDLAVGCRELLELIEQMNDLLLREFRAIATLPVRHVKLWENLTIETMGPAVYRAHLVPMYERILEILAGAGQKLHVHYDGKLRPIAEDIRRLGFDGLDSLTPPPEGDLSSAEARRLWKDKFLWLHPTLAWFGLPTRDLLARLREMIEGAGPTRCCIMISEELPPNWEEAVPAILEMLRNGCRWHRFSTCADKAE